MTGKKALERLKADPELVARATGRADRRVFSGVEQYLYDDDTDWRSIHDSSTMALQDAHWTLYRRKRKERDVFKDPKVGDVVQRPMVVGEATRSWNVLYTVHDFAVSGLIVLYHDGRVHDLTRAEFAARALPPFNWQVISRAKD